MAQWAHPSRSERCLSVPSLLAGEGTLNQRSEPNETLSDARPGDYIPCRHRLQRPTGKIWLTICRYLCSQSSLANIPLGNISELALFR